jgi:hypothetical protein
MNLSTKDIFMKQNHGRIYWIWLSLYLILPHLLYGEDFSHKFNISKSQPYLKEAVLLTLEIKQTNPNVVLLFSFDLEKSNDYTFRRVDIKEEDGYHSAYVKYSYLIYPLKSGVVSLKFKLQKRLTTDESIAYSYSGDRDNIKGLVTTDSNIELSPIKLNVQPLPAQTELVGAFKLTSKFKTHKAKVYQAIPCTVTIKGQGYPPIIKDIIPQGDYTLFKEQPLLKSVATIQGTQNSIIYNMALSHNQSFILKARHIKAFNPKTKTSYTLTIPQQKFEIEKVDPQELIDQEDSPKPLSRDFSSISDFFSYLMVFIAGYFTALLVKSKYKKEAKEENIFKNRVKSSKSAKELLALLMAENNQKFQKQIEALERLIYTNGNQTFKEIQNEIILSE